MISNNIKQMGGIRKNNSHLCKTDPLITIITVVYNDSINIEKTINSVLNQTFKNYEYIIIDGSSTDGTLDVIKKYDDNIDYWISEKDEGVFDAMNKGIKHASGTWINFMNSGDIFTSNLILEKIFQNNTYEKVDILYGDSIAFDKKCNTKRYLLASENIDNLLYKPVYRHGSSFTKSIVHKKNLFDLSMSRKFPYALDFLLIYNLYFAKFNFQYIHIYIMEYDTEGVSSKLNGSLINYKITNQKSKILLLKIYLFSLLRYLANLYIIKIIFLHLKKSFLNNIINGICNIFPFTIFQLILLKILGLKIQNKSKMDLFCTIYEPKKISIGKYSFVGRNTILDGNGGIIIGNNVQISYSCLLITSTYDKDSVNFLKVLKPIIIEDNVRIDAGSKILPGVRVGNGSVITAGSVVLEDVPPFTVFRNI